MWARWHRVLAWPPPTFRQQRKRQSQRRQQFVTEFAKMMNMYRTLHHCIKLCDMYNVFVISCVLQYVVAEFDLLLLLVQDPKLVSFCSGCSKMKKSRACYQRPLSLKCPVRTEYKRTHRTETAVGIVSTERVCLCLQGQSSSMTRKDRVVLLFTIAFFTCIRDLRFFIAFQIRIPQNTLSWGVYEESDSYHRHSPSSGHGRSTAQALFGQGPNWW